MTIYQNKVKFINGIINKEIKIMNVKKAKLFEYLESNDFYKVDDGFDYLTNMAISTLTKERVIKLEDDYNKKIDEYKELKNTEIEDIWKSEIEECVQTYREYNELVKKDM